MRTFLVLTLLAGAASAQVRSVVLATNRSGRIEIFDAFTLANLGRLTVRPQAESTSASPDGRILYTAEESLENPGKCCDLFALDLETRRMCPAIRGTMFGTPSPDGRFVFTQRASGAVELLDARTLFQLTSMKAPGLYSLHPSPDGRWLFGVTNSPSPSVDIFDMAQAKLAHRLALPEGPAMGAWAGDRFYVLSYGESGGRLWTVEPGDASLRPIKRVELNLQGDCGEPMPLMLAGSRYHLFVAEVFGFQVDRRRGCKEQPHGGIFVVDPSSGSVRDYIGEEIYVNRMIASPDGRALYVLDSFGPDEKDGARLLRLDASNGRILASRESQPGVWNLALAQIPEQLIPHGRVPASVCPH